MEAVFDIVKNLFYALLFLFLYEWLWKNTVAYMKSWFLKGYYIVCAQSGMPFHNSPDGIPNCLVIKTKWHRPNIIYTLSKDYDKKTLNKWKTWMGKINMDSDSKGHGVGYYIYKEGNEPGIHEIFQKDKWTIMVRVTDLGKADLPHRADNEPSLQIWKKINRKQNYFKQVRQLTKA